MGVVYEAIDRERQQRVALKALHGLDPQHLLRLKREFRSLQGIVHPNLVSLLDLVCEEGHWFITMELVEGRPFLAASIDVSTVDGRAAHGEAPPVLVAAPAPDEEGLRARLQQLVEAVDALHQAG